MTDAVRTLVRFSFNVLRLHRIEAATQPGNSPSIRVLQRTGFVQEGYARDYLRIDGVWRDHLLFGVVAPPEAGGGA
jgi:ribosomal-protein-alanine N-acetyltransferase